MRDSATIKIAIMNKNNKNRRAHEQNLPELFVSPTNWSCGQELRYKGQSKGNRAEGLKGSHDWTIGCMYLHQFWNHFELLYFRIDIPAR